MEKKERHSWVQDVSLEHGAIYCYECRKCKQRRIKQDFVTYNYYSVSGEYLGTLAPVCAKTEALQQALQEGENK